MRPTYSGLLGYLKRVSRKFRRDVGERKPEIVVLAAIFTLAGVLGLLTSLGVELPLPPSVRKALEFEPKDVLVALATLIGLICAWIVSNALRRYLERRPTPRLSRRDVGNMVSVLFVGSSDGQTKRLRRFHPVADRTYATADRDELLAEMTVLNHRLFNLSVHGQPYDKKLARNGAHVAKNPNVIRLMSSSRKHCRKHDEPATWVGFTHVLPISRATYDRYVRAHEGNVGIEDVDFTGEYICGTTEEAYAFLLFTIALDGQAIRRLECPALKLGSPRASHNARVANLIRAEQDLLVMAFEHLRILSEIHNGGQDYCRVIAQAMLPSTERALQATGFHWIGRSADEEQLYERIIQFD